jgi:PIN domain nuclease of toxin-antitoxin system
MIRLLLDTCAFYWWDRGTAFSDAARRAVEGAATETFVSAASAWEIVTKWRSGKQPEFGALASSFLEVIAAHSFHRLPLSVEHALHAANLPMHHRDPFDRMMIAQSLAENMPIVTPDAVFDRYGVARIW